MTQQFNLENPNVFPYGRFKVYRCDGVIGGTCISYANTLEEAQEICNKLGAKWHGIEDRLTVEPKVTRTDE